MPDYDETTDPAYRGDAEITARVEEDAATRDELERDQAAELEPAAVYQDGVAALIHPALVCSCVSCTRERLAHGNSGPGGPLTFDAMSDLYPSSRGPVDQAYPWRNAADFVAEARATEAGITRLCVLLRGIADHDTDYDERYGLVLTAVAVAHRLGFPAGFRIDPAEPTWPVAYIELPTGQVSWHMPAHTREWDGHTTDQKYQRIRAFCGGPR